MYIVDGYPELFDGATNLWRSWQPPIYDMTDEACIVVWRDSFIMLGAYRYQKFNLTTQQWSKINSNAPALIYKHGCLVLPSEDILVAGGVLNARQTFLYNPAANTWKTLSDTNNDQSAASIIQLGKRIFILGGTTTTTEEFDLNTFTWSNVATRQTKLHNGYSAVLALPAETFAKGPGGCRGIN